MPVQPQMFTIEGLYVYAKGETILLIDVGNGVNIRLSPAALKELTKKVFAERSEGEQIDLQKLLE